MNNYNLQKRSKEALMDFYDKHDFVLSFSGTYKQVLHHADDAGFQTKEHLCPETANKTVHRFLSGSSRRIFGCSQAQKGKRLFGVGYIEGVVRASVLGKQRIHNHMFIGGPIQERFDVFDPEQAYRVEQILNHEWNNTPWGYDQVDLRIISEHGTNTELPTISRERWQDYIHKQYDPTQSERLIMCLPKAPKID